MSFDTLVIDGDSLIYRCGFAAKDEPVENCLHSFKLQVQRIEEECACFLTRMYIKGKGNFRDTLAVTQKYKGNRTQPPPEHYEAIKEYALEYQKAECVDGMEADDMCSVELYANRNKDSGFVLAALDKDLWNTPGWHYNYGRGTTEYVTLEQANLNFIRQMLTGDYSDNIPGLPRILDPKQTDEHVIKMIKVGPKTADKVLEGMGSKEAMRTVWEAYKKYGEYQCMTQEETLAYFVEQGRLLWMTRHLNADGSPVLWEPPAFLFKE